MITQKIRKITSILILEIFKISTLFPQNDQEFRRRNQELWNFAEKRSENFTFTKKNKKNYKSINKWFFKIKNLSMKIRLGNKFFYEKKEDQEAMIFFFILFQTIII